MKFEDFFELITFDLILETLGLIFAIGLIWAVFFGGGINPILELLIEKIS